MRKGLPLYDVALGVWLLLFGVAKAVVGTLALTSPAARDAMAKEPVLRLFVESDTTAAGKFAELVLVLFGLYSLAHGGALLGFANRRWSAFFEHPHMYPLIYGGFAALLLGFYSLVLFTNVAIEKDPRSAGHYWLAWASGFMFLLVPVALALWQALLVRPLPLALVAALALAAAATCALIWLAVRRAYQSRPGGTSLAGQLVTLATIPLSAM